MRVAIDIMSGEAAPEELILGGIEATQSFDISVAMIGDKHLIEHELTQHDYFPDRIHIVPSFEVIGMGENPVRACKKKSQASIVIAQKLVKKGFCQAIFSPGNTGATVVASIMYGERIPGIKRPALAVVFPKTNGRQTLLLDCGATMDVNPDILTQFALIGETYAQQILGIPSPSIGLLNVGKEWNKGNKMLKETHKRFEKMEIDFIGNIEGNDIFSPDVDICVTDGVNGNILLKMAEGLGLYIYGEMERTLISGLKYGLKVAKNSVTKSLGSVKSKFSAALYGGAPLLGINHPVVVGHGVSNHVAAKYGIKLAYDLAQKKIQPHIEKNVKK